MIRAALRLFSLAAFLSLAQIAVGCSDDGGENGGTQVNAQKTCDQGTQCVCSQDCSLSCDGGGCKFVCDGAAKCSFSCKGGNCQVSGTGATTVDCSGGGCIVACSSATCGCTDPSKCITN